jgi:hypothetical protein
MANDFGGVKLIMPRNLEGGLDNPCKCNIISGKLLIILAAHVLEYRQCA